jgi:hypothetical protein
VELFVEGQPAADIMNDVPAGEARGNVREGPFRKLSDITASEP